jgi:hypothetical protein
MSAYMDNFHFCFECQGEKELDDAIALAFMGSNEAYATHYRVTIENDKTFHAEKRERKLSRIVFFSGDYNLTENAVAFPFKATPALCADFARRWLAEVNYGDEPDHDGSNSKGWRVYNEKFGHIDNSWNAVIAVSPVWAMHGK